MTTPSAAVARAELDRFMKGLVRRNPGEPEFHQRSLNGLERPLHPAAPQALPDEPALPPVPGEPERRLEVHPRGRLIAG